MVHLRDGCGDDVPGDPELTVCVVLQAVLAFVTLREGCPMTAPQVEAALGQALPPYAVPQVLCVEWIPLLVNGKVDRQALLRSYAESYAQARSHCLPDYSGAPDGLAEAARVLLDTVADVLGASVRQGAKICLGRSFYELGGNSLNSVLTVTRLREQGFFISEFERRNERSWRFRARVPLSALTLPVLCSRRERLHRRRVAGQGPGVHEGV